MELTLVHRPPKYSRLQSSQWRECGLLGPALIFDKSFLQMLNPEEVTELSMYFRFVGTPLLIQEIIADLKKQRTDKDRVSQEVVKALATKMLSAHGLQPADFQKLAILNLCCIFDVPMFGQVPVDANAPNVSVSKNGASVVYDATLEQNMWRRWANGDFTTDDEESALAWREGLQGLSLDSLSKQWKRFASDHFEAANTANNLPDLIRRVNATLNDFSTVVQRKLLLLLLGVLECSPPQARYSLALFNAGLMPRIRDLAPYAASVLRLYLTFMIGLGRGFIGPRTTHLIDLEYLLYAPFCSVFVSADKFHRVMWPAASGINNFIWGADLKQELKQRVEMRSTMTEQERLSHAFPSFPGPYVSNSIIERLWSIYYSGSKPGKKWSRKEQPETLEDLEPEMRESIEKAQQIFDGMRSGK